MNTFFEKINAFGIRLQNGCKSLCLRIFAWGKRMYEKLSELLPSRALRLCLLVGLACVVLAVSIGTVWGIVALATPKPAEQTVSDLPLIEGLSPEQATVVVTVPDPEGQVTSSDAELPPIENDPVGEQDDIIVAPPPETEPTKEPDSSLLGGRAYEKGDENAYILEAQKALMELGYMDSDEPTEYFGSHTLEALTTFQRHNGLEADGVLGETTYALLTTGDPKEFVMQAGDEGDNVESVQDRLYELGYLDRGSRTGTFGEKTEAAVKEFQQSNGLTADGKVGEKTMQKLYSSDVVGNYYEYGDTDESIVRYQKRLIRLGYLSDSYEPEGKMDSKTVSAIKDFQDANGLVRDGCLGPTTMEQLDSDDAVLYAIRLGMSGSEVKSVQKRLAELGYLKNSQTTGYFGEITESAVKSFQKRNNLTNDGEVGSKTLAKLNSENAKKAASSSGGGSSSSGGSGDKDSDNGSSSSSSSGVEKFIKVAKSKLGCPYVRGAKGPDKFDCSGFVYWCLNQAGVRQGYMTSIAWRTCSKYRRIKSMSDIKRGDVLVFKGSSMSTGHVGIYLGNGEMIDASSGKGKVRITDTVLSGSYWKNHFLMAYRIWD